VPHECLLLKLHVESLGVGGKLLLWLRGFLTKRYQRVIINGLLSERAPVTSGIPQGSVLGLLLFLLYVNDLAKVLQHSSIRMSADDVYFISQLTQWLTVCCCRMT